MTIDEERLRDALEHAPPTWNQRAIERLAADPPSLKERSTMCARCDGPCEDGEICASVAVHELDLLSQVGRDQAFHHVEAGIERLTIQEAVQVRETDLHRPNTFIELLEPEPATEGADTRTS
ncbi:hypothetical protein JCM18237_31050 [Halorubrum luteum]